MNKRIQYHLFMFNIIIIIIMLRVYAYDRRNSKYSASEENLPTLKHKMRHSHHRIKTLLLEIAITVWLLLIMVSTYHIIFFQSFLALQNIFCTTKLKCYYYNYVNQRVGDKWRRLRGKITYCIVVISRNLLNYCCGLR